MDSLNRLREKFLAVKITKSWHYLAYLYLVLPALLFAAAYLTRAGSLGKVLGTLFHNYGLFAVNPIPNFSSFTGIVGLGMAIWFLVSALRRRDMADFLLTALLVAL
ncbi:MAG: hypothetical protein RR049_05550, partial [Angelakisella sp.]